MTDQESGAGGAELVRVVLRDLRAAAAQGRAYTDPAEVAGLIARLVREREEAITENIALEKDKRTLATGMGVLRADLATVTKERDAYRADLNDVLPQTSAIDWALGEMNIALARAKQAEADLATARERIASLEIEAERHVCSWDAGFDEGWMKREARARTDLARLDSARAILEEAREFIYVNQSPKTPLAEQCDMLDRIDSWLASGEKKT